jgi:dethiobiotin synthetase
MSGPRFVVTGTDTDIGKTVFAAALTQALGAHYWKPVQAGRDEQSRTDSERVAELADCADRIVPEAYVLGTPCSPHRAAEIDGVTIEPARLMDPETAGPLVIEGAGGALVPLTREVLFADIFAQWGLPVIVVTSTRLGTINHTLLTLEALRARGVRAHGVAFIGDANTDSEATICTMGKARRLGRLPHLARLDSQTLASAFAANFDLADFAP